jgi:hypothetical protein
MEEEQMSYNQFLEEIRVAVREILGRGYDIHIQQIRKNNGVLLDGLIIGKAKNSVAPTIYLNSYYMDYYQGKSIDKILEEIMSIYKENSEVNLGEMRKLMDFSNLKDRVAFKLIQKEKNQELLKEIPYFEFLDLAVVFYLLLDENHVGQMTALIHNSHMEQWGITVKELNHLAKKNTPILLPPEIRTMEEVIRDIFTKQLTEFEEDLLKELFETDEDTPFLYVLSNKKQINGAGCILYDGYVKQFAEKQKTDIIILPSSLHEVLLMPDRSDMDYEEMKEMVKQINREEVPVEDILSNRIYRYSLDTKEITIVG